MSPQQTFANLGVTDPVVNALRRRGAIAPFAIQSLVIKDVLDGRDVLAQSPTGSGKTLAFGVPLVECTEPSDPTPSALVLAPTRELASQIVAEIEPLAAARGLRIASVYGGVGLDAQAKRAAKAHIVVATPGRLEDQLQRRAFDLREVRMLVLDEADRMLDMGFKPAVDRIVKACPRDRQTLFFSATLEGEAGKVAGRYTEDAVTRTHKPKVDSKADIEHRFELVEREARIDKLVEHLSVEQRDLALVFVRTKRGADRLVKRLGNQGVKALAMHGDKTQGQRERALKSFTDGKVPTLIATDVAARGIDVDGITHVIQFDPPADADTYTHRVGRTGRAGATGIGVTFVGGEQKGDMRKIAAKLSLNRELDAALHGGGSRAGRR